MGLQPKSAFRRESYGAAIGYSVAAPLALNRDELRYLSSGLSALIRVLVCILLALISSGVHAQVATPIVTDPQSGIEITMKGDYSELPPHGGGSVHLRIQNNSTRNGSWHVTLSGQLKWNLRLSTSYDLAVESGQARTFSLQTPFGASSAVSLDVAGPGIERVMSYVVTAGRNNGSPMNTQLVALSRALAARSFDDLKKRYEKKSIPVTAVQFEPEALGEDWRGYAGIECLCISEGEWDSLSPPVRNAIRQWVAQGGHLELVAVQDNLEGMRWNEFHLPPGAGPQPYGFGRVEAIAWNGRELDAATLDRLSTQPNRLSASFASEVSGNSGPASWRLMNIVGKLKANAALILLFVILFAITVGPVNLFYLAPAGRRHRLFVTTPLLSIGGSVLLMAVILLQEGVGGYGGRITILHLLPDAHEALILQEQVSRTGLLLGSNFNMHEDTSIVPIEIDGQTDGNLHFATHGQNGSGDWFRSRAIQGQRLAAFRPTRATVTVVATGAQGAPVIVSSIEATLDSLIFADGNGKVWRAHQVRTGVRTPLQPMSGQEAKTWWLKTIESTRGSTGSRLSSVAGLAVKGASPDLPRHHYFFATAARSAGEPIPTLSSIHWNKDEVIWLGPIEMAPDIAAPGAQAPTAGGTNR